MPLQSVGHNLCLPSAILDASESYYGYARNRAAHGRNSVAHARRSKHADRHYFGMLKRLLRGAQLRPMLMMITLEEADE